MENNNKSIIKIINMASEPIKPNFKENKNGSFIEYGADNMYADYLLDCYNNKSNKHKAIINKKVSMTTGNGIQTPQTIELQSFIDNKWSDLDLEEISSKINYDLEIYGGFALQVKWSIDKTKVVSLDYIDYHKVRLSTDDEKVFICKDWKKWKKPEYKPIEYQKFDPNKADEFPTQIFYYLSDTPGQEYYPIPFYSSTLNWIELDFEISNFHYNSVRNGFMPSFLLNFATGIPSDEEMNEANKQFEKNYCGSQNAGKFIVTYSEGSDQKPELTAIQLNDSDEKFLMLYDQAKEEIFIGHQVTSPMLFGVRTEGQLGGRQEMLESLAIFQSTYIKYKQELIQKQLDKISKFAGVNEPIIFNKYIIDFSTIENNNTNNQQ